MMVLKDKQLKEIDRRVKKYLQEKIIQTKTLTQYFDFFLKNSEDSLNSARALYDLSTNKEFQEFTGYIDLKGFLWVINASYYSMFYMARALLEKRGIKLNSDFSIHSRTFDALIYFFYLTGKLQKELIKQYIEAKESTAEILGREKADKLVEDYFFEKGKRADLTYQTGEFALTNKAKTSLERATKFNKELRKIIQEK